jgi:hypothetical protein
MFIEIVVPREDLRAFLDGALPFTLRLGEPGSRREIALSRLLDTTLVPGVGFLATCQANVRWPTVVGVDVPLVLSSLQLRIALSVDGGVLRFEPRVERADVAGVPTMLDDGITRAVNARLVEKGTHLAWSFERTLGRIFPLPARIAPLEAITTRVAWGKVRVTGDALVLAVSVHATPLHSGEVLPEPAEGSATAPRAADRAGSRTPRAH